MLKQLPEEDLDHIFGEPDYEGAIHIAAHNNSPNLIKLLLEAGCNPNIRVSLFL